MRPASSSFLAFTALILIALFALSLSAAAQNFAVLQNFDNANGKRPLTAPILGSDGTLYGATPEGGAHLHGLVYKLTSKNELSALYSFCSQSNCADGASPEFGPILGKDGNLYGTTSNGGANNLGVVYRLTLGGTLTVLHSFSHGAEGWDPNSLVSDGSGGFYGTTLEAGVNNYGTIFHLDAQGELTTLYSFCGSQPTCAVNAYTNTGEAQPLILGTDGNLYGITTTGGHSFDVCPADGCGTVFKITPQGEFGTIYEFCSLANCADGGEPAWLIQGSDGNFYGTTSLGGSAAKGGGTVFQLTTGGVLSTLHSFSAAESTGSGYSPYDLVQASNGTLFGVTFFGGNYVQQCEKLGCGTVFSVTTSGDFASLHNFDFSDGLAPAGIVQTSDTTLDGTTSSGGAHAEGVIFSVKLN